MKGILVSLVLLSIVPATGLGADNEAAVRKSVQAFYTAFDQGFVKPGPA